MNYELNITFAIMKQKGIVLLADSGSTKTAWRAWQGDEAPCCVETPGINPVQMDTDTIIALLSSRLTDELRYEDGSGILPSDVCEIHFYGAGCLPSTIPTVQEALKQVFPRADIHVQSDLLGAARALCGHTKGIACILGTGSNSCLYDGERICAHTPPLGYILGDEGSGAVLGRQLLGDLLKGLLPAHIRDAFSAQYNGLETDQIIEHVYRQPQPNRYLAGFTHFIAAHRDEPSLHRLLTDGFRSFFLRNVTAYARPDLPVHLTGSIAAVFADEVREAAQATGFTVGRIEASPISGMTAYHRVAPPNRNTY